MIQNKMKNLLVSAQELKTLTSWPEIIIEDYLKIVDRISRVNDQIENIEKIAFSMIKPNFRDRLKELEKLVQTISLRTYFVSGPANSIDNEVPVFDGISGKKIKSIPGLTIIISGDVCTIAIAKDILFNVNGAADERISMQQDLIALADMIVIGTLYVSSAIGHRDDPDTGIVFSIDQIDFYAGGQKFLTLDEAAQDTFTVNSNLANIDFAVNGDSVARLIYTDASVGNVNFGGGVSSSPRSKTSLYSVLYSDHLIYCDGSWILTLPPTGLHGQELIIVNTGTGTIIVDGSGAETINGLVTQTLAVRYSSITLRADKNNSCWYIIADTR